MKTAAHEIMLKHIAEEPLLIRSLLDNRKAVTEKFCDIFLKNKIRRAYFSGSGSPANACEVLRFFCEKLLKVEASYCIPTVFNHHFDFNTRDYAPNELLLICPAESGRTKGTVLAAQHARELGIHTVCSTFNLHGLLAGICDVALYKPSGLEIALPSTKGHVLGIFLFLLSFVEAAYVTGKIERLEYARCIDAFYKASNAMEDAQEKASAWFREYQDEIMDSGSYWFIGYGANYATAKECALKFLECTKRPSFGYEQEEFMHGPLCAVKSSDMVFFLCAEDGKEKERMYELFRFCRQITPRCVMIQRESDEEAGVMPLPFAMTGTEMTSVLELLVPMQVLAYHVADCLGYDLTQHSKNSAGKAMSLSFSDQINSPEETDE